MEEELIKEVSYSKKNYEWRNDLYKRDGFTCVVCQEPCRKKTDAKANQDLPIIYAYRRYSIGKAVRESKFQTLEEGLRFKPIWDTYNAFSLCSKCYRKNVKKEKDYAARAMNIYMRKYEEKFPKPAPLPEHMDPDLNPGLRFSR